MHASMNSKVTFNLTRHDRRWPQAEPPRSVSSHLLPIDLAPHSATKRYIPAQHAPRPEQGAAALKIVDIRQKGVGVGRNSACRRSQCAFRSPTRWVRWDMARFACGSYFFFFTDTLWLPCPIHCVVTLVIGMNRCLCAAATTQLLGESTSQSCRAPHKV